MTTRLTKGKLEHYDQLYAYNCYKKNHLGVDQNKIAEYFPVDKTLKGMIEIYRQFFGLLIQEVPRSKEIPGLPDDLKILEVRKQSSPGQLQGVILLDLFPREGKNTHSATSYYLSLAFSPPGGPDYPSADVVIGNFTKSSPEKPALIKHGEVILFFHEFGHAIHSILGRTEMLSVAGKKVKRDFVEVPSVLLEKWMLDPGILKSISSHYETGEPLPDKMIERMRQASVIDQQIKIERFHYLARLSLAFFAEGRDKNPDELMKAVWEKERPHISHGGTHFHNTWWHFTNTGAKHYFYLLAEVLSPDLFEEIHRRGGLRNPDAGAAYVQHILGKGGSQDPKNMLKAFLGENSSRVAFLEELTRE